MLKLTVREIKASLGRWLAIFAIVALGVGFFCGLRLTKTAMLHTLDSYLDGHAMYDYRLISTLGFTDEDVEFFKEQDGVSAAEGARWRDVLCNVNGHVNSVLHAMSVPSRLNTVDLKSGRMPQAANECLADAWIYGEDAIGQTIMLSDDNDADTLDAFSVHTFTIVGVAKSPLYINYERGTSSVGNGAVNAFFYVLPEVFTTDYYTDLYLTLSGASGEVYSEAYDSFISSMKDTITALCEQRADARYQSLYQDARQTLDDARATLDEKQTELADAKQKLLDAEQDVADGEQKLADAQAEYDDGLAEFERSKKKAYDGFSQAEDKLDAADEQIAEQERIISDTRAKLDAQAAQLPDKDSVPAAVWEATIQPQYEQLQAAYAQLSQAEEQLEAAKAEAKAGWNQYFLNRADVVAQLDEAQQTLDDAKQALLDGAAELADGRQKITDAKQEITDGEQKLADAEAEYSDGEKELSELTYPDIYVLNRDTNVGYACFESDSDIVNAISCVFPLFFFMVAALVCITTITRMVDEQRTQTGLLKALGYSDGAIISEFLIYAASASILGCVVGIAAGSYFLPKIIWQGYNIMYGFTDILWAFDWPLAIISSAAYLACALAATWYACRSDLLRPAAELIRPKAPKPGQRILLERVPAVWKHIPFLHKVSIRNTLRYKKRMIMMAIGIGGCTALLITGFGIRDSIQNVVSYQYEEITQYDATADFSDAMDNTAQAEFLDAHSDVLNSALFISEHNLDCTNGTRTKQAHVIVAQGDNLTGFIDLHNDNGAVAYPGQDECIISVGLADALNLAVGDTLTIHDSDMNTLSLHISGVFTNYVFNYVYLTQQTYESQLGTAAEMKSAWLNLSPDIDPYEASAAISGDDSVTNVSLNADLHARVNNMMKSLNYIVLLVVICAGALAFIVLYNLTNINITERIREIATIKVLGFYEKETNAYVFRENIILTVLGILVGIPMGIALHAYVMAQIQIDMIHFDVRIAAVSYAISIALTLVFALIVDLALRGKIRRIDMAQALKSIE